MEAKVLFSLSQFESLKSKLLVPDLPAEFKLYWSY